MSSPYPYSKEPLWRQTSFNDPVIPQSYLTWLLDKGSLTQKVIREASGVFRVELVKQTIETVTLSERRALKIAPRRWCVVREVILYGKNKPWIYARTIIPLSTLKGSLRHLHYLGNKPLGEALFNDPSMKREPIEVARLEKQWLPSRLKALDKAWIRRSVFTLSNKPLLVHEIFLPDIIKG